MASDMSQDEAVAHFSDLTGAHANEAKTYLTTFHWQMDQALQAFYEDEDDDTPGARSMPAPGDEANYTGPRTLDGRPVPYSSSSASASSSKPQKKKATGGSKLRTLGDLSAQDEDDDDEDEGPKRRDLFAGGEKSGLAVQDPNQDPRSLARDIIEKARRAAERGGPSSSEGPSSQPSRFTGSGQTLGGEGVPSRTIPGPRGTPIPRHTPQQQQPVAERTLHMWEDGFSIDDGPLHRHDDPRNAETLRMINAGRVPLDLMNINYDEQVEVKLEKHDENWRQLPRIYRPFGGEGRRLGSPVPGDGSASASSSTTAAAAPAAQAAASSSSAAPTTGVDESQPVLTIRLQLPNGSRVPARFNTTQTVGDVYEFVQASVPETRSRNWVLATTFPNKEHIDRSSVLGEMGEFKKGGTAVVKWV